MRSSGNVTPTHTELACPVPALIVVAARNVTVSEPGGSVMPHEGEAAAEEATHPTNSRVRQIR
jgi:hypothetical protein